MIRLALCITDLNVGGAERCLAELAARIERGRFSPVVYSLAPEPGPGETSVIPTIQSAGVEVVCFGAKRAAEFPFIVARLARMLRERETQVVQSFLFHANMVGRFAAWRAGVPHVICGIRVAERRAGWRLRLDRITHRMVDRYVCVSRSVAEFSASAGRLPADKFMVIPNGIDVRRFSGVKPADKAEFGAAGKRLVAFIGRLDVQKGLPELLASAVHWLPRLSDCDLLLVGKGPMEAALRRQCRDLGIAERVHFAGWRADIPAILTASSLLVLASAWEGMPNVILEAMAAGLPVAATRVEGVCELLGPSCEEQSVPYGKWDDFTSLILQSLSDPNRADRLGRENRLRSEHQFTIERMVDSYQDLWEQVLTRSG